MARDPVERAKRYLEEFELATAAEIKEIEAGVRKEVDAAVEGAKAAPEPERGAARQPAGRGRRDRTRS